MRKLLNIFLADYISHHDYISHQHDYISHQHDYISHQKIEICFPIISSMSRIVQVYEVINGKATGKIIDIKESDVRDYHLKNGTPNMDKYYRSIDAKANARFQTGDYFKLDDGSGRRGKVLMLRTQSHEQQLWAIRGYAYDCEVDGSLKQVLEMDMIRY